MGSPKIGHLHFAPAAVRTIVTTVSPGSLLIVQGVDGIEQGDHHPGSKEQEKTDLKMKEAIGILLIVSYR